MPTEVDKVVCYVIHDGHLLVSTHDSAPLTKTGVQVPAGTVEHGETFEHAAARELLEETGRAGTVPCSRLVKNGTTSAPREMRSRSAISSS